MSAERAGVQVAENNAEAAEAWSGSLFDRFVRYRDLATAGLGAHGDAAMRAHPPRPGDRVIDLGCGFGDTTQQLAALVGPDGSALGIDVSEPFIELARREAEEAGVENVRFEAADVQVASSARASTTPSRGWGSCSSPTRFRPCAMCGRR